MEWFLENIEIFILSFINILIAAYFNRKLKKYESLFSIYNKKQIEILGNLNELLYELWNCTKILMDSEKYSLKGYNSIQEKWTTAYLTYCREYSKKIYIIPKNIREYCKSISDSLRELKEFVSYESNIKSMFIQHEDGTMEFMADDEALADVNDSLKKYDREKVFSKAVDNIICLRNEIIKYFDKIDKNY